MPTNNILETRSTEMDEVIGNIPPWIVRWGITATFIVGALVLFISSIVQYPDVLTGNVTIQGKNQPGKVVIRRKDTDASQSFRYLVKDGDGVQPGDTLFVQTNTRTKTASPVITPMAGVIYITYGTTESDMFEKVIWVIPSSSEATVKINYKNTAAGNVKVGQTVKIELDEFPDTEYGFITGKIASILPMEVEGSKQAVIELSTHKIITSQNREIPILPTMKGSGEILLTNKTILKRIFGSLVP